MPEIENQIPWADPADGAKWESWCELREVLDDSETDDIMARSLLLEHASRFAPESIERLKARFAREDAATAERHAYAKGPLKEFIAKICKPAPDPRGPGERFRDRVAEHRQPEVYAGPALRAAYRTMAEALRKQHKQKQQKG